jgi:hypothetical protein
MVSILGSFLIALYPALALLSHNIEELHLSSALRSLLVSVIVWGLLLLILQLIVKDWGKAGLLCSVFLILFFSYGNIYSLLKQRSYAGFSFGHHKILLPLWILVAVFWVWWVSRKLRNPANVVKFFNAFGIVLFLLPVSTLISHQLKGSKEKPIHSGVDPGNRSDINRTSPDIYYIILDGYARADILEEIYGYNNSGFINYLQERGFYVAEKSSSNYNQTAASLASSLSLDYVNDLSETMAADLKNRQPLANRIKFSHLSELLESRGYEVVAFETGYERTELENVDHYWSLETEVIPQFTSLWRFNAFETLLLESTMARIVFDLRFLSPDIFRQVMQRTEYQAHRERILFAFDKLDDIATMEGDYFVFAHLISPHPPFVFGSQGKAINPNRAYRIEDGDSYPGDKNEYIKGYKDQLSFINVQVMQVIDRILTTSDTPPIIIIQGDHGPGAYLVWDSAEKTNLKERYGILNAYYFPDGNYDELYPSITPVNSFRSFLNYQFGTDIELLPDESYFAPWMRPYDFVRVTDSINYE